jgi:hypothetical protein
VNQHEVHRISELSLGPGGRRPIRPAPTLPATVPRAVSSPRSTASTQSSRSKHDHDRDREVKNSPRSGQRSSPREGSSLSRPNGTSSTMPPNRQAAPRSATERKGSHRTTFDRSTPATSTAPAAAAPRAIRPNSGTRRPSSSHEAEEQPLLPLDNEELDRAIALSLADSEVVLSPPVTTAASRPRSSSLSAQRGGMARESRGTSPTLVPPNQQQRESYRHYGSRNGSGPLGREAAHRVEFLDDDEELARAIAASLSDT